MNRRPRMRFWIEAALAGFGFALALFTVVSRDWIEAVFHVAPDHGSGALEWALVAVLLGTALCSAGLARTEWHQAVPTTG